MRTWVLAVLLWCVLGLSTSHASGQSQTSASQPKSSPLPAAVADSARTRREIETIQDSLPKIPDRGAALYLLARRYAQLGDEHKALALLKECVALDEGFDPSTAPAFEALRSDPEFRALVDEARRRYPPIHQARVAFTIEPQDLFPEGLAVDADRQIFYMGSMHHKKILKISKDGQASDFVKEESYGLLPLGGIKVDSADHGLWAASDDGHDSELLHFNSRGRLLERFRLPGEGPHVNPVAAELRPSAEMQKLFDAFRGKWAVSESFEISASRQGKSRQGVASFHAGPGFSLIEDYKSRGSAGPLNFLALLWWDQSAQAYRLFTCANNDGCAMRGTAKWEGGALVNTWQEQANGKPATFKDSFVDISPSGFRLVSEGSADGKTIWRVITKYTRLNGKQN